MVVPRDELTGIRGFALPPGTGDEFVYATDRTLAVLAVVVGSQNEPDAPLEIPISGECNVALVAEVRHGVVTVKRLGITHVRPEVSQVTSSK